jgi:hypothetical protein
MESRELAAGCGWELRSRSGLGWDGNMTEGQGMVGDMTFRDSDRDVTRAENWHDEDGDVKASQGKHKNREAGSWR